VPPSTPVYDGATTVIQYLISSSFSGDFSWSRMPLAFANFTCHGARSVTVATNMEPRVCSQVVKEGFCMTCQCCSCTNKNVYRGLSLSHRPTTVRVPRKLQLHPGKGQATSTPPTRTIRLAGILMLLPCFCAHRCCPVPASSSALPVHVQHRKGAASVTDARNGTVA